MQTGPGNSHKHPIHIVLVKRLLDDRGGCVSSGVSSPAGLTQSWLSDGDGTLKLEWHGVQCRINANGKEDGHEKASAPCYFYAPLAAFTRKAILAEPRLITLTSGHEEHGGAYNHLLTNTC